MGRKKKVCLPKYSELEASRGSLDFLEFVMEPNNSATDEKQFNMAMRKYVEILGGTEKSLRETIFQELTLMRHTVERESFAKALHKEHKRVSNGQKKS